MNDILNLPLRFINFVKNIRNMETASFSGFIKILFYFISFYYVFKFLARLFLPVLVKKVVEKAGQNFQQQYQQNSQSYATKDEVIFDTPKVAKPRETKKVGDYVDFEEID